MPFQLKSELRARRAGQGGMYVSRNPDAIPPSFMRELRNCSLENDAWETEPGATALGANLGTPVAMLTQWTPVPGVYRLIAVGKNGTVYRSADAGETWQAIYTGLQPGALVVPVEGGQEESGRVKKLFLFGAGMPLVISGDTTGAADGLPDPTVPLAVVESLDEGPLAPGQYFYGYTFETLYGESLYQGTGGALFITKPGGAKGSLTIPQGPPGTIGRNVYRTKVGPGGVAGAVGAGPYFLLHIDGNDVATPQDDTPDSELDTTTTAPYRNTTASIHLMAKPPTDWRGEGTGVTPVTGFMAENRLVGVGSSVAPHQLYVSSDLDHENFTDEIRVYPIYPGEGERLVAGFYWKQRAWLFKQPVGLYTLDTRSLDLDEWQVGKLTDAVGIAGPRAYCLVEASEVGFDDVVFLSPDLAWHRLTKAASYQFGDASTGAISETTFGQWIRDHADLLHGWFAQMLFYSEIAEVQAGIRLKGSPDEAPYNNIRVKANIARVGQFGVRFHWSDYPASEALTLARLLDGSVSPLAGGLDGAVRRLHDYKIHAVDGAVYYRSEFWHHDDNFQDIGGDLKLLLKAWHFVTVEYESVGSWPLVLEVYVDGVLVKTLEIPMARGGFILDSSHLDQAVLSGPEMVVYTKRLFGRGRRISMRGYVREVGQYFRVVNLVTGWSPAGIPGGNKL